MVDLATQTVAEGPGPGPGLVARVLRAALTVFVLDGLYVVLVFVLILRRTTVERVFQGIASAVLGPSALTGGWPAFALGLLLHFSIALAWSIVWIVAYERSEFLRRATNGVPRAALVGAAYGLFIWLAMHYIVLPLTYSKPGPLITFGSILVAIAHLLVVGPPIVLIERTDDVDSDYDLDTTVISS
jgi:hypothetical protein